MTDTADILDALSANDDRPKLNFFGRSNEDLEKQAVCYVLDHADKPFMQQLLPFVRAELFDCAAGYGLMKLIQDHREEHGTIPARGQILKAVADALTTDDLNHYETIESWLRTKPDPRCYEYLTRDFVTDLKYRAYYRVATGGEIADLLATRSYDELDLIFSKCFPSPDTDSTSLDFKADIDAILAADHIQSIGTGYPTLDKCMHENGPARGEVLVWLANTGVGKTTMLLNAARHAERKGLRVLYVALEGTTKAVAQRLVSIYADAPTRTLHDHAELVRRSALAGTGEIRFIQPKNEVWTARHITKKVEHLRVTEGFRPDVICIDYAKLLRAANVSKVDAEYVKLARIMDEVKRLALEADALVLTAQQANREGEGQGMVGLKHAAGSYDALQPVDYVISVNQTPKEEVEHRLRLVVNKNRHGRESVVVQCAVNRASGLVKEAV